MTVASLVAAASKTAIDQTDLEVQIDTWAAMGRQQGADPDYLQRLASASVLVKQATTIRRGVRAVEKAAL